MRCQWYRMHRVIYTACIFNFFAHHRCFAYDFNFLKLFENFFVHAMSVTPHAPCMRCQWHRMHFKKFEYLHEFRTDVLMKKTEGWKFRDTVPLNENICLFTAASSSKWKEPSADKGSSPLLSVFVQCYNLCAGAPCARILSRGNLG
jgi:hypothetical protein